MADESAPPVAAVLLIAGLVLLAIPAAISLAAHYFSRRAKRPAGERK
jgi:hypothetical protein